MNLRGEVRNAEALGRMLQQGRLLNGLSQRELADQLGIGQKWIWEMENGKPGLFTDRLFQMLRATGCHLYVEAHMLPDSTHDGAKTATPPVYVEVDSNNKADDRE